IAIPSAPGSTRARIVRACRTRGVPVRTLPTVFELLQTRGALARQMREVRVEDVLGREPVVMELDGVSSYLAGATVLVTGAGGSIGSELCRQIARLEPHRMVLLDHAEDNLFAIQRELEEERHVSPSMLAAVLADCKEEERMREVLAEHRPTVLVHAAAYKLVGQRGPDLPPPDRTGRPGDGYRRAHDALLHDDPRGCAADHQGGLAGVPGAAARALGLGHALREAAQRESRRAPRRRARRAPC